MSRQGVFTLSLLALACVLGGTSGVSGEKGRPAGTSSQSSESDMRGDRPRAKGRAAERPERVPEGQELEDVLDFTRQHFPDVHSRLVRARQEDARGFQQMVRRLGPPMAKLMRIWRDDPAQAERMIAIQKLEMRLRDRKHRYQAAANDQERAALRQEMQRLVERKFDLRQARMKAENDDLRRRLDDQTRRLDDQEQHRQQIIADELANLLEPGRLRDRPQRGRASAVASQPATGDSCVK